MLQKIIYNSILPITILMFCTCSKVSKFNSPEEMYKWINNPSNGFVKSYENNGVKLEVKYLPPEYLAWQQISDEGIGKEKWDSLVSSNQNNRVFLMVISPGAEGKGDVMYKDLQSVEEYKKRTMVMNFDLASYIELSAGSEKYRPVLATLENTYSATDKRTIFMVFTDETQDRKMFKAEELDFVFNDELFNTGVNHLVYKKKEIDTIPTLAFLK